MKVWRYILRRPRNRQAYNFARACDTRARIAFALFTLKSASCKIFIGLNIDEVHNANAIRALDEVNNANAIRASVTRACEVLNARPVFIYFIQQFGQIQTHLKQLY